MRRQRARRAAPRLPSYAALRARAAWRDREGRYYVFGAGADAAADADAESESESDSDASYVLLPVGETRRRGTPALAGADVQQIEFPESGDVVVLLPLATLADGAVDAAYEAHFDETAAARAAPAVRVESVDRVRQRGAVARIEFSA
jgi:hypothetical protein